MEIKEYLELPYTKIIRELNDESGHYFYGKVLELEGCQSTGDTVEELYSSLNEAMELYIKSLLEMKMQVPVPEYEENYSGRFVVRIPKSLHYKLAMEARSENISLNQYVAYRLAKR